MIDNDLLLFVEPEGEPSKLPIIDGLTLKMTKALRRGIPGAQNEKWTPDSNKAHIKNKPPHMLIEMPWNDKYDFTTHTGWMGLHECSCGAISHSCNYLLPSGDIVNSLCIHYLAFHRGEVTHEEQGRINDMPLYSSETIVPTDEELEWPPRKDEKRVPLTRQEYLEKNN
jgi:hypothetical protein